MRLKLLEATQGDLERASADMSATYVTTRNSLVLTLAIRVLAVSALAFWIAQGGTVAAAG
jgi:hypothetical protein